MAKNSPLGKFDLWASKGLLTQIPSEKRSTGYTGSQTDYFFASYFNTIINEIDERRNTIIDMVNYLLQTSATEWLSTTSYENNAVVTKDGWIYIAKRNNTNATPDGTDDNWAQIARVAEVEAGLALKANIDSPTLTGSPKTPTLSEEADKLSIVNIEWLKRFASNNIMRGSYTIDFSKQDNTKAYPVILAKNGIFTDTKIYRQGDTTSGNMFLWVQALPSCDGKNTPIFKIENAVDNTEKEFKRFVLGVEWKKAYPFVVVWLRGGFSYNIVQKANDPLFEKYNNNTTILGHDLTIKEFAENNALEKFFWESYDIDTKFAGHSAISLVNWDLEDYNKYMAGEKVQQPYKLMKMEIPNYLAGNSTPQPEPNFEITFMEDAVGMNREERWNWVGAYPCVVEMIDGELREIQKLNPNDYTKTIDGEDADITTLGRDVVVKFRRMGYRYVPRGTKIYVYLTDEPFHPAFRYDPFELENITPDSPRAQRFYLGAYPAFNANNKSYSVSGKTPTNLAMGTFMQQCVNRTTDWNNVAYGEWHWYTVTILRMLLFFVAGTRDLRNTFGCTQGYTTTTGATNKNGMNNELVDDATRKAENKPMKALGLDQLFGYWQTIAGVHRSNTNFLYLHKKSIVYDGKINAGMQIYDCSLSSQHYGITIGMEGSEDMPFLPCWFVYKENFSNIYNAWQSIADKCASNGTHFVTGIPTILSFCDLDYTYGTEIAQNRLLII